MHVCKHLSPAPPLPAGGLPPTEDQPREPPESSALDSRRVLLADDDPSQMLLLERWLVRSGYAVEKYTNGQAAWDALEVADAPALVILDWMMPGLDGLEICRRLRARAERRPLYVLMLTGRGEREDLVLGLEAGADDYVQKPAHREELLARVRNATRIVELQAALQARIRELEHALANVSTLQGLLPICAYCKKIRDDGNYWQQVEAYIASHSAVQFSHGICPDCYDAIVEPQLAKLGG